MVCTAPIWFGVLFGSRLLFGSYLRFIFAPIWFTGYYLVRAPRIDLAGTIWFTAPIWFTLRAWTPLWSSGRTSSHSMDTLNTIYLPHDGSSSLVLGRMA